MGTMAGGCSDPLEAAEVLLGTLDGETRRRIVEAGRAARYWAVYRAEGGDVPAVARLDEIEREAAMEEVARLAVASGEVRPVSGGSGGLEPLPAGHGPRGTTRLTLHINGTAYILKRIPCDVHAVQRCWEIKKSDGTAYHVSQHAHGAECTCGDFEFRRNHIDPNGCKHIRSLVAHGLIENAAITPPDRYGDMPGRERGPAGGPPPSARYTERTDGPGRDTWRGGHDA